jgi:hypothetical protein
MSFPSQGSEGSCHAGIRYMWVHTLIWFLALQGKDSLLSIFPGYKVRMILFDLIKVTWFDCPRIIHDDFHYVFSCVLRFYICCVSLLSCGQGIIIERTPSRGLFHILLYYLNNVSLSWSVPATILFSLFEMAILGLLTRDYCNCFSCATVIYFYLCLLIHVLIFFKVVITFTWLNMHFVTCLMSLSLSCFIT